MSRRDSYVPAGRVRVRRADGSTEERPAYTRAELSKLKKNDQVVGIRLDRGWAYYK